MTWISDFTSKNAPIVALAPMDGYCDSAFRAICQKVAGGNIVVFSEFYSADGLHHNPELAKRVLIHDPIEHPLVFQIFGNTPEVFLSAGKIIESYGAQGVDINMGCPAKKVVKCGYGSGLMIDRDRAMKIVNILAENLKIPVSVKTRLGWDGAEELVEFGKCLEQAGASLISVHGRTYKQEYTGSANWEPMFELQKNLKIPVVGNGDCKSYEDGLLKMQKAKGKGQSEGFIKNSDKAPLSRGVGSQNEQGGFNEGENLIIGNNLTPRPPKALGVRFTHSSSPLDRGAMGDQFCLGENLGGFMIARASLGNPWCFLPGDYQPTWQERLGVMAEHMQRMVATKGANRACLEIRKHFTHYLHGFEGVREYRKKLAMVTSVTETESILKELYSMDVGTLETPK